MRSQYSIVLEPNLDEQIFTVSVPALPGCVTQGRTESECIERAKEAIAAWIADAEAAGETVPEETQRPQVLTVEVGAA